MTRLYAALAAILLGFAGAMPVAAVDAVSLVHGMMASTAQLRVERDGGGRRTGSSVVLQVDRQAQRVLLLTAAHVLTPIVPQKIFVVTPLRRGEVPARVLAVDDDADLALVETAGLDLEAVAFADEAMLGDEVLVTAFPWGRRATLVRGMVSQVVWNDVDSLTEIPLSGPVALIDASVSYGMSGGGVFNRHSGALLGIVRGYRSAQVAVPGNQGQAITFPVAGETTVVPTTRILCFLTEVGYEELVPPPLGAGLTRGRCETND